LKKAWQKLLNTVNFCLILSGARKARRSQKHTPPFAPGRLPGAAGRCLQKGGQKLLNIMSFCGSNQRGILTKWIL